ncbi:MAG: pyruvate kinase [Bryobacteraceae bacterium]|nr:pyruvate kinase [Bryobacteraceae bacterium]
MRNTKIVATLGPASASREKIAALLESGVDVFRLNASHGAKEQREEWIAMIRSLGRAGILLDLQGPKIRLEKFEGGGCRLENGAIFTITTEAILGNAERASTSYAEFARDVRAGDPVLIADGALRLRVLETDGIAARCIVEEGGFVGDRKGINLPGVALSTPSVTKKDYADLDHGVAHGIDMVALSFVRRASDVVSLRDHLRERGSRIPVIAKIEKPEGVANLPEIVAAADGLMVARGDLGVEMPLEKVPAIQKRIIDSARRAGKFVITATQMLESMMDNPNPTRAEVSDVANAIYDGTDAVMLSGETSAGRFPVQAVQTMAKVAAETDSELTSRPYKEPGMDGRRGFDEIIADAATEAVWGAGLKAVVVFTTSGSTARLLARQRPPVPIYAFTPSVDLCRQLSVLYGVRPVPAPRLDSVDEMLEQLEGIAVASGLLIPGDAIAFVAGVPIGRPGTTNTLKLHRIGEIR